METEKKIFDFKFETKEFKEETIDGLKIGVIKGYASTYDNIDKVDDIVKQGAFTETLTLQKDNVMKMLKNHNRDNVIGGFPVNLMQDTKKGLYVVGHINLEVEKGRETYALAKQGVINKMSIGYKTIESTFINDSLRVLEKLELKEISIVPFPANEEATIIDVKNIDEITELKDVENFLKEKGLSKKEQKALISKINSLKEKDVDKEKNKIQRDVEKEEKQRDVVNLELKAQKISQEIKQILLNFIKNKEE